jgi:hypothetical protein
MKPEVRVMNENDRVLEPARSRMDAAYMERRTEMFRSLNLKGYWRIGTGDPKMVPKRKAKKKTGETHGGNEGS